jgi:nucleoside-diphosphate-sugar epimerase
MKIFVTGASGFIGKAFITALHKVHPDMEISCGVRDSSDVKELRKMGLNLISFDLTDPAGFKLAIEGQDIVVHFAANIDFLASEESLFQQNVDATKYLAYACMDNNVTHLIYCSSAEALGVATNGTEETDYNPDERYGKSKMEAEKLLLALHEEKNLPVTIVRPSGVFGPGDNYVFKEIIESFDHSILNKVIPFSIKTKIHFTYIDDIVQGLIKILLKSEISIGEIFHLCSDKPQTYEEIFVTIAEKLGRRKPIFLNIIPIFFYRPFWPFIVFFYRWRGLGYPYVPNTLKKIRTNRSYSNLKAKEALGFHPKTDFAVGVENAVEWMRIQGILKK